MNDMQKLEQMGFRFSWDGMALRVRKYGAEPTAYARDMLAHIDKETILRALKDREQGFQTVEPEEVRLKGADIKHFANATKAAIEDGELLSADVCYRAAFDEAVFYLTPPGVDVWQYMEKRKNELLSRIMNSTDGDESQRMSDELGEVCACLARHYKT